MIPGIYNYCDRWCERCPLATRCLNFAMEQENPPPDEGRDLNNRAFWDHLSGIFQTTMQMILQTAAEQGIDLSQPAPPEIDSAIKRRTRRRALVKNKTICRRAMDYVKLAERQLETMRPLYRQRGVELARIHEMRLKGHHPMQDAEMLFDATEVVQWYQHFIYVKLRRALDGQAEEAADGPLLDDDGNPFPSDADGSAKVALIAIDRSLAAWATLRDQLPDAEAGILQVLIHLDRLRRQIEAAFPQARGFHRPGFDD